MTLGRSRAAPLGTAARGCYSSWPVHRPFSLCKCQSRWTDSQTGDSHQAGPAGQWPEAEPQAAESRGHVTGHSARRLQVACTFSLGDKDVLEVPCGDGHRPGTCVMPPNHALWTVKLLSGRVCLPKDGRSTRGPRLAGHQGASKASQEPGQPGPPTSSSTSHHVGPGPPEAGGLGRLA